MLALVLSVVPRQSLLVCIESDGCVTVEAPSANEHCDACEPHGAGEHAPAPALDGDVCACVDVEVPGFTEALRRATSPSTELASAGLALGPCSVLVVASAPPIPRSTCVRRAHVPPRPPDALEQLRTVELRV